jgi:hypothetical protein
MKRWEVWLFHSSTVVVAMSGIAYFWMKYLMETDDPFSVVNHPWQTTMLSLHLIAAPVLVFVTGLLVQSHIRRKLASGGRPNRGSGLASILVLPVMIASGYMLQIVSDTLLAQIALYLHIGSSTIFVGTYLVHQIVTLRLRKPSETSGGQPLSGRQLA